MTREELHTIMEKAKMGLADELIPNMTNILMDAFEIGQKCGYEIGYKVAVETTEVWMREQVYQEYGGGPMERLIPDSRIDEYKNTVTPSI